MASRRNEWLGAAGDRGAPCLTGSLIPASPASAVAMVPAWSRRNESPARLETKGDVALLEVGSLPFARIGHGDGPGMATPERMPWRGWRPRAIRPRWRPDRHHWPAMAGQSPVIAVQERTAGPIGKPKRSCIAGARCRTRGPAATAQRLSHGRPCGRNEGPGPALRAAAVKRESGDGPSAPPKGIHSAPARVASTFQPSAW